MNRSNKKTINTKTYGRHLFACSLLLLSACQATPQKQLNRAVEAAGYSIQAQKTDYFAHKVLVSNPLQSILDQPTLGGDAALSVDSSGQLINVYIEGDGRPWWTRTQVSSNPTYGKLVGLGLMRRDSAPALYIGRPCYFEVADKNCSPEWWTDKRYSRNVVESMNAVLDRYIGHFRGVRLFGHSGGGVLAYLMASQRADVVSVVTVAANLDIDRWADHHGYTRLAGSLNPANRKLSESVFQLHVAAEKDRSVPATLIENFVLAQQRHEHPQVAYKLYPEFSHQCCWEDIWNELLEQLPND